MLRNVYVFLHGMWEFRLSYTANYDEEDRQEIYEAGREFAHQTTFRFFEEC